MTYDIHGGWSSHAGHNSPLFQSPPGTLTAHAAQE